MRTSQRGARVVVAVVVLVAASAMVLTAGLVAPGPSPPAAEARNDVSPAAPARTGDERDAAGAVAAAGARVEVAGDTATRSLQVRIMRKLGDRPTHYVGPLQVTAGNAVLADRTLVNRLALSLEVPATGRILFTAPGHEPAELDAAEALAQRSLVQVVLRPLTALRIEATGVLDAARAKLWVQLSSDRGDHARAKAPEPVAAYDVPFVEGVAFAWQAWLVQGSRSLYLSGREPALQAREQRRLLFDFAALRPQRYRLVGPSSGLLAELSVFRRWGAGELECSDTAKPDPDGSCELVPVEGAEWTVSGHPLRLEPRGDEVLLHPPGALLGIGIRDAANEPQETVAWNDAGQPVSGLTRLHVFCREQLPPTLRFGRSPAESQEVRCSTLPSDRDVVWLPREERAQPVGTLRVRVRGTPPAADVAGKFAICVSFLGQHGARQPASDEVSFELAPGTYTVSWSAFDRGLPIARECQVRAGESLDVDAEWPQLQLWSGSVLGFDELPPDRRWTRVSWGEGGLFGTGYCPIFKTSEFRRALLPGETLDGTWQLYWDLFAVPARAEVVDAPQHRFVVRAAAEVRWVSLRVEIEGPWRALVAGPREFPLRQLSHDNQYPIPVARGQVVNGVISGAGRHPRTLAWWTITDGVDELRLRPAGGRTIELRPVAACANRGVVLIGPGGQRDLGYDIHSAEPLRVFAPDGTRAIAVFDGHNLKGTLREIPLGASDVVVID
ncbi:MAG TPA: hypothetical protein VFD82_20565 [Planctomycetota bacterium]|nr:hypothetical protein [Planctomycetota bacterium]